MKQFKVVSLYFFLIVNLFSGLGVNAKSIVAADIVEGQQYVPNFLKQKGHFEKNANGISAYADAAGTRPVNGSGGAPTLSCTRTTSSPIDGDGSLLITKDAANRQGEGCTIQFTIDSAYKAKVLQIEFDYIVASGTFTAGSSSADSDIIAYLYDVSNSTLIEPSSIKLLSNSTTIADHFVANFQTSATGTTYNLILHQATTSASAYTVKADNIQVKPSQYVYGTPITDWVSYTPTVSNLGTGSTSSNVAKWRRVGDSAEYMITFQKDGSGGSGASVVTWDLVSGQSIDATKLPFGSATAKADNIGSAWVVAGSNYSANSYFPLANSATTFAINKPTTSGQLTGADIPASTYIIFRATVPITGWSSSTQQSDGYDGRRVDLQLSTNAGTIATSATTWTTITFSTPEIDDVSCWNGTDTCTIKSAGDYEIGVMAGQNSAAANYFRIGYQKNSDSEVVLGQGIGKAGGSALPFGSKVLRLAAGDTIKFKAFTESTEGISTTRSAYIKKVLAPTTISATEKVTFMAEGASSTAVGSNTVIPFNTPTEDSHGGWNSTNKDWAAPEPGTYKVNCQARVTSGGATVNQYLDVIIQVDTVSKREFAKYVENTGVSGWEAGTSWQGPLTSGQKIRCVADTNIGTPSLTTGATHTFLEIFRIK